MAGYTPHSATLNLRLHTLNQQAAGWEPQDPCSPVPISYRYLLLPNQLQLYRSFYGNGIRLLLLPYRLARGAFIKKSGLTMITGKFMRQCCPLIVWKKNTTNITLRTQFTLKL